MVVLTILRRLLVPRALIRHPGSKVWKECEAEAVAETVVEAVMAVLHNIALLVV